MPPLTAATTRFRKLATRLIAQSGNAVTITRTTAGAFNAVEQTRGADVVLPVLTPAVMLPYTPLVGTGMGMSAEQQTAMLRDGLVFKVAAVGLPFEPLPGDTITDPNGVVRRVVNVVRTAPDGNAIVFTIAAAR